MLFASLLLTLLSEISNRRIKVGFMPLNILSELGVAFENEQTRSQTSIFFSTSLAPRKGRREPGDEVTMRKSFHKQEIYIMYDNVRVVCAE